MNKFAWEDTKQFSVLQTILAFALPALLAFTGFRIVLPNLVTSGMPSIIAWPLVASTMLLLLVVAAVVLLKAEAKKLNITLVSRMCIKRLSAKLWLIYTGIAVGGMVLAAASSQLVAPFMAMTGISIPDYMPFFLNPGINPAEASPEQISPGFPIKGQFLLIPLIGVTLLLNILAEELYFRAWILPKMSGFGSFSWMINGVLFALYHVFQFWLFPTILIASLVFAFVVYHSKSIVPAFVFHFIANFLFSILAILLLVLA